MQIRRLRFMPRWKSAAFYSSAAKFQPPYNDAPIKFSRAFLLLR